MYYVTATDKMMSGWGMAEGKTSKIVWEYESYTKANKMAEKLKEHHNFTYVKLTIKKPYYDKNRYHTSYKKGVEWAD